MHDVVADVVVVVVRQGPPCACGPTGRTQHQHMQDAQGENLVKGKQKSTFGAMGLIEHRAIKSLLPF